MQVRFIAFNSCDSDEHAQKLSERVDFTIGHRAPVKDLDALDFSVAFWNGFFDGMPLAGSFTIARSVSSPGYRLYAPRVDPSKFSLRWS